MLSGTTCLLCENAHVQFSYRVNQPASVALRYEKGGIVDSQA